MRLNVRSLQISSARHVLIRIRNRVSGRGFIRSVAVMATGSAAGQAVVVMASPILTRLYEPQDMGVLTIYSSLLMLGSVVATLRLPYAIPLPEGDDEAANVFALSIVAAGVFALFAAVCILVGRGQLEAVVGDHATSLFQWLLPIGILLAGIYAAVSQWAVRSGRYKDIAKTKARQGLGNAVVSIAAGAMGFAPGGLILGQIVGQGAGVRLLLNGSNLPAIMKQAVTLARIRAAFDRFRDFVIYSTPGGLLNNVALYVPALIIASHYGPQVAGFFGIAQRVVGMPVTLIGNSVAQVLFGETAKLVREGNFDGVRHLVLRVGARLFLFGGVPTTVLLFFGPTIFAGVFGEEWAVAGHYTRILAVAYWFQFIGSPLAWVHHALERQDLTLIWNVFRVVVTVGALAVCVVVGLEAVYTLAAFSVAVVVSYIFLLGQVYGIVRVSSSPRARPSLA